MKNIFLSLALAATLAGAPGPLRAGWSLFSPSIQKGDTVTVNYRLTVDNEVVDSSYGKKPLTYVQETGKMIPGFEEQLRGLKAGDKKSFSVPPEKGYGPVNPKAIQKVPMKAFKKTKGLKVGMMITGQNGERIVHAKVVAIGKKDVTLDFNSPMAGKTLNFDVEVIDVKRP